jgi:pimeloyl-ACP methyl ester carboxylesterase
MPSIDASGRELHYVRGGTGEPLLLIQGMSATHLAWGRPFSTMLEKSFDCIAFDNRGMGRSAPVTEEFTIADLAADTLGLLDALEIERAHVFGFSMGGMAAQELALGHPDRLRSLTLGGTYCGGPQAQVMAPADFQGLLEAMASGDRDRVYRAMWELNLSPAFRVDESRYAEFDEMARALPAPRRTIGFQLQAIAAHDTSARLADISIPTLVIHGSEDRVLGVANGRLIASLIPAPLEIFEDVGHMFFWEQPERSAKLVREHALTPA